MFFLLTAEKFWKQYLTWMRVILFFLFCRKITNMCLECMITIIIYLYTHGQLLWYDLDVTCCGTPSVIVMIIIQRVLCTHCNVRKTISFREKKRQWHTKMIWNLSTCRCMWIKRPHFVSSLCTNINDEFNFHLLFCIHNPSMWWLLWWDFELNEFLKGHSLQP